jgi:bleomycin hydrolase
LLPLRQRNTSLFTFKTFYHAQNTFNYSAFAGMVFSTSPGFFPGRHSHRKKEGYVFTDEIRLPATPVKNQFRSGTCWSFGTNSLIESELLRMDKGEFSLSEMFVVRHTYAAKAERYVRLHGNMNFSAGGALPDAFWVLKNFGMVPDEAYDGKVIGEENHVHGEMDAVLKAYVDAIIKNPNRKLTPCGKTDL